jgi:hypothetical protein
MKPNTRHKLSNLPIYGFVAKDNLGLDIFSIEPTISKLRKELKPKEFKSVSRHLVRVR